MLSAPAALAQECGGSEGEDCKGGRFGGGDVGLGDGGGREGLAEIIENVGEVGEVDRGRAVEVAGGPGKCGQAKVVEDGGEVGEVDVAV